MTDLFHKKQMITHLAALDLAADPNGSISREMLAARPEVKCRSSSALGDFSSETAKPLRRAALEARK